MSQDPPERGRTQGRERTPPNARNGPRLMSRDPPAITATPTLRAKTAKRAQRLKARPASDRAAGEAGSTAAARGRHRREHERRGGRGGRRQTEAREGRRLIKGARREHERRGEDKPRGTAPRGKGAGSKTPARLCPECPAPDSAPPPPSLRPATLRELVRAPAPRFPAPKLCPLAPACPPAVPPPCRAPICHAFSHLPMCAVVLGAVPCATRFRAFAVPCLLALCSVSARALYSPLPFCRRCPLFVVGYLLKSPPFCLHFSPKMS